LHGKQYGFINFHAQELEESVRYIRTHEHIGDKELDAFAAAIVKNYDAKAYETLKARHNDLELINYSRRQDDYHVVDAHELLDTTADHSYMRGKIVLMGFMGPDLKTRVIEENRFTPLNPKFSGKAYPDMYGIVIHANIISMILEGAYINKVSNAIAYTLAFIVCWLHIVFFIQYYVRHHKFYHLVTKFIQLLTFVLLVYVSFWLMAAGYKMSMGAMLGAVALSVDVLYFYDGFVTWLHQKTGYKTVFGHH
jgi:CHASE2 domain-containing sensor protein